MLLMKLPASMPKFGLPSFFPKLPHIPLHFRAAVMEVEDGHMLELVVKLPASMPLRAPELECRKRASDRVVVAWRCNAMRFQGLK
jgi:hypothetical protein